MNYEGSAQRRLRFNSDDDLCLLREVAQENPLKYPERWNIVQANIRFIVGKEFRIRTLKRHLMILMKKGNRILNGNRLNISQEFYSEKNHLLQEISDMYRELSPGMDKRCKTISKELKIASLGLQVNKYNLVKEDNNEDLLSNPEGDFVEEIVVQTQNPDELNNFSEVTQDETKPAKWTNNTKELKVRNLQDAKCNRDIEEDTMQSVIEDEKFQPNHPPPTRTRLSSHEESRQNNSSDEVIDTVIHCVPSKKSRQAQLDGVDHLFLSYAATFRTFRPLTQAKMKLKLATMFSETELKELQEQNK